jgi:hypothetical protein
MFNYRRKIVSVTFFDQATRTIISSSRMPLERLPETFAVDTELKMNDAAYVVVSATPRTKEEFAKTKELKVVLRKRVDP